MLSRCGALPGRTYYLAAVRCVLSTTVRVDGLSMSEVLWSVCAVWVLDLAFCVLSPQCTLAFAHHYLTVFIAGGLWSGVGAMWTGCVNGRWTAVWALCSII